VIVAALVIVAAIAIAEMFLSAKWNRFYFTIGLPIFISRVERRTSLDDVPLEHLQKGSATAAGAPLVFERLDSDTIAFRERALGGLIHYTPLMHGVIRRDPASSSATVMGLMNWFILALMIMLAAMLRRDIINVLPVMIAVLAVLYLIQGIRFWRVARALRAVA